MMERLAEQEMEAAAAEEEEAVKLEHERRLAAAMALLNKHNPNWFALRDSEVAKEGGAEPPTSRRGSEDNEAGYQGAAGCVGGGGATGDEKLDAAEAVARQRALARAILNEHNADWFGELEQKKASSRPMSRRSSLFRRLGSRKGSKDKRSPPPPPGGNGDGNGTDNHATPTATPTPPPRTMLSSMRSESPPSMVQRRSFGRNFVRGVTSASTPSRAERRAGATPAVTSSGRLERHRSSPWFSRTGAQSASASSCPATPAGSVTPGKAEAVATSVTSKPGDIGADGPALTPRSTPTPLIQPPLMDVLENKSEEPMSLRSLLRFTREKLMEENVLFYLEVSSFKSAGGGQSEYLTHLKRIFGLYVRAGSAREINISGDIRNSTTANVQSVLRAEGNGSFSGSVDLNNGKGSDRGSGDVVRGNGVGVSVSEAAPPCGFSRLEVDCSEVQHKEDKGKEQSEGDPCVRDGDEGEGRGEAEEDIEQGSDGQHMDGGKDQDKAPGVTAALDAPVAPAVGEITTPEADVGVADEKEKKREDETLGLDAPLEVRVAGVTGITQGAGSSGSVGSTAHPSGSPPRSGPDLPLPPALPPRPPRAGISPAGREQGHCSGPSDSSISATESSRQEAGAGGEDDDTTRLASSTSGGVGGGMDATDMDEIRERRESSGGVLGRFDRSMDYSSVDEFGGVVDFDASGEIEELGLEIGPGGGYGDRTIFDLALLEIFVVLRHEVYPKFVARVMETSRQAVPVKLAAATHKSSISGSSSPESTLVPIENQRVSWSESDEVSKAVRAELAKRYY
eukprot:g9488.t1